MLKGTNFEFVQRLFSRDFYTSMLVLSVFCLLVASPQGVAAPKAKDQAVKPNAEQVASKVNINKADAETIASVLTGVGLKKAEAIVVYRKQKGKFKSLDELLVIKGIGEGILEKNRAKILL